MAERIIQSVAATSDANGAVTFNLSSQLGSVYQGTIIVPGAPSGASFSAKVANTGWGTWAGPTNFGPVQLWDGEPLTVTGSGLTTLTQYVMTFTGVLLDSSGPNMAAPLPPVAPSSMVGVETATVLVANLAVGMASGSFTFTVPPLTRRLTVLVNQAGVTNAGPFQITGGTTNTKYGVFTVSATALSQPSYFAIEPAADAVYTIKATSGSPGTGTVHMWVLATATNPYFTNFGGLPIVVEGDGLGSPLPVQLTPATLVFSHNNRIITANANNQVLAAAPGAGTSIWVQTLTIANGAITGVVHPAGGAGVASFAMAANQTTVLTWPGGFELPANTALQIDTSGVADCSVTYATAATI